MGLVFGLTGGIACGKSTVSQALAAAGVVIVDPDLISREITRPGEAGHRAVTRLYGDRFLRPDDTIDRGAMAAFVFNSKAELAALEAALDPLLLAAMDSRIEAALATGETVCLDAALLIERGLHERFRPLVVVAVPFDVQLQRLRTRNGLDEEAALARIRAQLPIETKIAVADYVIDNTGTVAATQARALEILAEIRARPRTISQREMA